VTLQNSAHRPRRRYAQNGYHSGLDPLNSPKARPIMPHCEGWRVLGARFVVASFWLQCSRMFRSGDRARARHRRTQWQHCTQHCSTAQHAPQGKVLLESRVSALPRRRSECAALTVSQRLALACEQLPWLRRRRGCPESATRCSVITHRRARRLRVLGTACLQYPLQYPLRLLRIVCLQPLRARTDCVKCRCGNHAALHRPQPQYGYCSRATAPCSCTGCMRRSILSHTLLAVLWQRTDRQRKLN
jgi:hypothetical protein